MADAVFLALSVLTVGSAIAALELRSLIYGSVALMEHFNCYGLCYTFAGYRAELTTRTVIMK